MTNGKILPSAPSAKDAATSPEAIEVDGRFRRRRLKVPPLRTIPGFVSYDPATRELVLEGIGRTTLLPGVMDFDGDRPELCEAEVDDEAEPYGPTISL